MPDIVIVYRSIDGCRERRKFGNLKVARQWAQDKIGKFPEMGSSYAVSGDGVGKIEVWGINLRELFPRA